MTFTLTLTEKELTTLIWAVQAKTGLEVKKALEKGISPSTDETIQTLNNISNKAYYTYMEKDDTNE